jgi:hypothetical protein
MSNERALFAVKLAHTVIFVFMASCVFYVLYCGIVGQYNTALYAAIGVILFEGVVLLLNRGRCPLTGMAERYGASTGRVSDIFCPAWFVPHVFSVFTTLFLVGLALVVVRRVF